MVRVWKTKSLLFCLRYDPLIVFRRQNHVTFIFIKAMSHELGANGLLHGCSYKVTSCTYYLAFCSECNKWAIHYYLIHIFHSIFFCYKQDPAASEQLTAKRPQENEPFNQKLKKLRASEVRSTDPDSRTPLRSLGTASAVERVSDQANYSLQKEGESQELVIRNTEEIGHSKPGSQETRNGTVSSAPHSLLEELVDNGLMGYSTPEQNYLSNVSNATPMMQLNQSFHPGNTDMGGDLSKHDGFVPFPGPSDISSPTFLLDVSQQPLGVRAQVSKSIVKGEEKVSICYCWRALCEPAHYSVQ